jgi:hypothetical protein
MHNSTTDWNQQPAAHAAVTTLPTTVPSESELEKTTTRGRASKGATKGAAGI